MPYRALQDLSRRFVRCFFFALSIFSCLALSHLVPNNVMARYDFLLLCCAALQLFMLLRGLESPSELAVITLFHLMGLSMELFKVQMHSWSYPEFAFTKFLGVPFYSGFMYAGVASFFCQSWHIFRVEVRNWPQATIAWILAVLLFLNFFTQHFFDDLRWFLLAGVLFSFRHAEIRFHWRRDYRIKAFSFFLIMGSTIWIAENIATFLGAWQYAYQHTGWQVVRPHKVLSWTLMSIVSIIVVVELKFIKASMRKGKDIQNHLERNALSRRSEQLEHVFTDLL